MLSAQTTIPTPVRALYTLLVAIIVPVYWVWAGPQNFLWFCDIALFLTLAGLWRNWSLPISMAAVSVLLVETVWTTDFLLALVSGGSYRGLTAYLWDPSIHAGVRLLSVVFHLTLLGLIPWALMRLGYDRRAPLFQVPLAWVVLPLSRLAGDAGHNLNWSYGLGRSEQTWMEPVYWVLLLMLIVPLAVILPSHWLLARLIPPPATARS